MTGLYEFLESAVSWDNAFLTFLLSLITAFIVGIIYSSIAKSFVSGIVSFIISELILIAAFFIIRDEVKTARLNEITKEMNSIEMRNSYENINQGVVISSWREGLKFIRKNPTEIGYYIKTVKYLEEDNDYESAATLLELGLDFMNYNKIPTVICDKLQLYYKHLPNRPKLDKDCNKIHEL